MITIANMLSRQHVSLNLAAQNPEAAIEEVVGLLRDDPEVLAFDKLAAELKAAAPCAADRDCGFGICIPHARTNAVSGMVMSVGRSEAGLRFPDCPHPVRYLFCFGLPSALNADYLRIVGLLTRILKNPQTEGELRSASTPAAFVSALTRLEAKL